MLVAVPTIGVTLKYSKISVSFVATNEYQTSLVALPVQDSGSAIDSVAPTLVPTVKVVHVPSVLTVKSVAVVHSSFSGGQY